MTRGQRIGSLTKAELVERLAKHLPGCNATDKCSLTVLLGHAIYYNLLSDMEREETIPRVESTIPCYLHTHVQDPPVRDKIDSYVLAASKLFRRGTLILNRAALWIMGEHVPGPTIPRFNEVIYTPEQEEFIRAMAPNDARSGSIKHAFLPERWPSSTSDLDPLVENVLLTDGYLLPVAPDWREVMSPSGWDNAINRMATKFFGNVQVHAIKNIVPLTHAYLDRINLRNESSRKTLHALFNGPLFPASNVHMDDMDLITTLRSSIGTAEADPRSYLDPTFSVALCRLHFFIVRHNLSTRSYLPIAQRRRLYSYIDSKIYKSLVATTSPAGTNRQYEDGAEITSASVGELINITPTTFNQRRKALRRRLVKQYRRQARTATPGKKRKKAAALARRWSLMGGVGRMAADTRVDSMETDGVGLRLCVKTAIDIKKFVIPIPATLNDAGAKRKRRSRLERSCMKRVVVDQEEQYAQRRQTHPVHIGIDHGRAKPFVAAISKAAYLRPTTNVFTRRRYYYESLHTPRYKWEQHRFHANTDLQSVLSEMAESGGLHNCVHDRWDACLVVERERQSVLEDEYYDIERARWTMLKFRRRKASMARAVSRLWREATEGEPLSRPIVITIGAANFASSGPGELPVPTAALSVAMKVEIRNQRQRGRTIIVQSADEYNTTKCCCACGAVTQAPIVQNRKTRDSEPMSRESRRLRQCTVCEPGGKLRDRDVQAARNILWLSACQYLGLERPSYLARTGVPKLPRH